MNSKDSSTIMPCGKHAGKLISSLWTASLRWYLGYDVHGKHILPGDQSKTRLFYRYKYPLAYQSMFIEILKRGKCVKCAKPIDNIQVDSTGEIYLLDIDCLDKYFKLVAKRNKINIILSKPSEECSICMDDSKELAFILPCCHQKIHISCLNKLESSICAFCRSDISNLQKKSSIRSVTIDNSDAEICRYLNKLIKCSIITDDD